MKKDINKKDTIEIKCPHCGSALLFNKFPKRRVHALCRNCNKEIEVEIK